MRVAKTIACVLGGVFLIAGCADSKGRIGGVDKTTVRGSNNEKLTLVKPQNITLTRGQAETVSVRFMRDHFNDEVRVNVFQLPSGVEALDAPRATHDDKVDVVLRVANDASLVKNHQALVSAEGPNGMRATETLEITVRDPS